MQRISSFREAAQFLERYWPTNMARHAYTLEYVERLLDFLGNPQEKMRVVHVSGTSGKTSTAYYAAALLKASGKRVGFTMSPHLENMGERVQIGLEPMAEQEFCSELTRFMELVEQSAAEPTYFELLVAFAFWQFARRRVEYAVIEVGMGGTLDATNVVQRPDKVCIITDIGLDHMQHLGGTIASIATHKAGIIQLHNSVFCYNQTPEIMQVIRERSRQEQADLHILDAVPLSAGLPHLPLFQQRNFGLALSAVRQMIDSQGEQLTDQAIANAAQITVPARMEIYHIQGKRVILDGAHNAQKMRALAESMHHAYLGQEITLLVSIVAARSDRMSEGLQALHGLTDSVTVCGFANGDERHVSAPVQDILTECRKAGFIDCTPVNDPKQALAHALKRPESIILITGSLYFAGIMRPVLRALQAHR